MPPLLSKLESDFPALQLSDNMRIHDLNLVNPSRSVLVPPAALKASSTDSVLVEHRDAGVDDNVWWAGYFSAGFYVY